MNISSWKFKYNNEILDEIPKNNKRSLKKY
jgi:hypothetical protein